MWGSCIKKICTDDHLYMKAYINVHLIVSNLLCTHPLAIDLSLKK